MDNDDRQIGRILSRRELLMLFGAAGAAVLVERASQAASTSQAPAVAEVMLLDVLVPRRLAHGRVDQFERCAARLAVSRTASRLLLAEHALREPHRHDLTAVDLLGVAPVLGSLYILGDGVDATSDCARLARSPAACMQRC